MSFIPNVDPKHTDYITKQQINDKGNQAPFLLALSII
jgi:hypothetical protein